MLRSQIKLTSYDFSGLHITGKFDNRPGTGPFKKISCVVTYRTGAGRRLYMKTSADARPGPVRRCKRSTGHCTVPGRFYTNCHVQWWIYMYIKIRHHTFKETVCSNKKDWGWLWQWWWWKTHLLKTAKILLVRCMLIILSCSSEIYMFVFMFFVFKSGISM